MNPVAATQLSYEAFAQVPEVDAPLVENELIEANLRKYVEFRLDVPAELAR